MFATIDEKKELVSRYGMKAWAHILLLEQQRGRQLNPNQIRCVQAAVPSSVSAPMEAA